MKGTQFTQLRASLLRLAGSAKQRQRSEEALRAHLAKRQGESPSFSKVEQNVIKLLRNVSIEVKMTDAERARRRQLMIDYGKLKRRMWLARQREANACLHAKWLAIDALPADRRTEALKERDPAPFLSRPVWTHTPPIGEHFDAGDLTKSE